MAEKELTSIFDLSYDNDDVLRLPFTVVDYEEHNHIERVCYECGESFPQGQMREIAIGEAGERTYSDGNHWYGLAIFYCEACWFVSDISDASKWTA